MFAVLTQCNWQAYHLPVMSMAPAAGDASPREPATSGVHVVTDGSPRREFHPSRSFRRYGAAIYVALRATWFCWARHASRVCSAQTLSRSSARVLRVVPVFGQYRRTQSRDNWVQTHRRCCLTLPADGPSNVPPIAWCSTRTGRPNQVYGVRSNSI